MSYDQFYHYQYLNHFFFKVNYNQHYKFHLKLLHFLQFTCTYDFFDFYIFEVINFLSFEYFHHHFLSYLNLRFIILALKTFFIASLDYPLLVLNFITFKLIQISLVSILMIKTNCLNLKAFKFKLTDFFEFEIIYLAGIIYKYKDIKI